VTVAVIDQQEAKTYTFNSRDFKIEWYSGTGCGGQNRNKVQSSCRITHLPTGLVKTAQTRSRENSLKLAKKAILEALSDATLNASQISRNAIRAEQVGSGMRGDKRRTYRFQDDQVSDDITGKRASLKQVLAGNLDLLW
jgi:peptide chain release factor 1